jgi:hypothetical protein
MNSDTMSAIFGFFIGAAISALFTIVFLVDPIKKEAIKRGYAEMKLKTPYDTESVFTWK